MEIARCLLSGNSVNETKFNNDVSKDSPIVWDTIGDTQMAGLHGLRNKVKFPKNRTN